MRKKILIFLSVFGMLFVLTGCKTQEEIIPFDSSLIKQKINAYIFSSATCPHCSAAKEFFGSIAEKYQDCFELVDYEVLDAEEKTNPVNAAKDAEARKTFNITEGGVPLIIIGDQDFLGYAETFDKDLISAIEKSCTSEDYKDLINPIVEEKEE